MTVAGVLLAAGAGDRFRGAEHKLLTPFRDRPLVCWALDAVTSAAAIDQVFVVVGAVDLSSVVPVGVTMVANLHWGSGQASSVRAGIDAARAQGHEAAVVGLADSPLVPASAWDVVAAEPGDLVTATFDGRRRPPTKLGASMWDHLPLAGDEGARSLIRRWPDRVREVACQGDPVDIDTLEDLAQWN